jgi:plasmid stabilization system protein ParE
MKYSVRIMPEAYHELEASAVWWAEHRSSEEALRWYDGFVAKLESLQSMPESHSLARENPRVAFELLRTPLRSGLWYNSPGTVSNRRYDS